MVKQNWLKLNLKKTHFRDFSKHKNINLSIQINGTKLIQQKHTKYLGLLVQDDLNWDEHIKTVIKRLNKQIPLYYCLRDIIPKRKTNMIFKSLSVSLINYGIELYGRHKNKWIDQLQKTQNRLIKILTKEHFRTNTNSLYKK